MKLSELSDRLDERLYRGLAESWDNVGWMVEPTSETLEGIMLSVDPSPEALQATIQSNCNVLLTHHPLIFEPLERLVQDDPIHETIMTAVKNDIGIYAAHTNVDSMPGGINDYLANQLNLKNIRPIKPLDENPQAGLGRIGILDTSLKISNLRQQIGKLVELSIVELIGDADGFVETVGICSGSGGDFIGNELANKIDLYVTADVKHHDAMEARKLDLPLMILDHHEMESVFNDIVEKILTQNFPDSIKIRTFQPESPYERKLY